MSVGEVVSHMRAGEFKPNCALGASCFLSRPSRHDHLFAWLKSYWIFWCAMAT